jgi:hypothetical protein
MNHLTAWAITITAFSSGLYSIYKYILAKYYFTYDAKPIHYWLNKKQKIKKRYKTFRKRKLNKRNISYNNYSYNKIGHLKAK